MKDITSRPFTAMTRAPVEVGERGSSSEPSMMRAQPPPLSAPVAPTPRLGADELRNIYGRLTKEDQLAAAKVCKDWHEVASVEKPVLLAAFKEFSSGRLAGGQEPLRLLMINFYGTFSSSEIDALIPVLSSDRLAVGEAAIAKFIANCKNSPDDKEKLRSCVRGAWEPKSWPGLKKCGLDDRAIQELSTLRDHLLAFESWEQAERETRKSPALGRPILPPRTVPSTPVKWLKTETIQLPSEARSVTAISNDRFVAIEGPGDTARVWSRANGEWTSNNLCIGAVQAYGHPDGGIVTVSREPPYPTRFRPAGNNRPDDGRARVWREDNNQWIGEVLEGHTDFVQSATVLPDGRIVTVAIERPDACAGVWRKTDGHWTSDKVSAPRWVEKVAAFSDSEFIASSNTLNWPSHIWSDLNGKWIVKQRHHPWQVHGGILLSRGQLLAWHGHAWIYYDGPGGQYVKPDDHKLKGWTSDPLGHSPAVESGAVFPDGHLVTASYRKVAQIWRKAEGKWISDDLHGHNGPLNGVAVLTSGELITVARDNTARVWTPPALI